MDELVGDVQHERAPGGVGEVAGCLSQRRVQRLVIQRRDQFSST
jgi:hypothetical protein